MTRNDVMVLGDATFRLTIERWLADRRRINDPATRECARIVAERMRQWTEYRQMIDDYVGGW
jgi:hypothetical protein